MADAAVEFLLQKVSTVLESYKNLISGADNDLEQLNGELRVLKSFLQDAAKNPKELKMLREIERQIRDVVYDAEDTIDTCLTSAATTKASRNIFRKGAKKVDVSLPLLVNSLRVDKVAPIFTKIEMYTNMKIAEGSGAKSEEIGGRVRKPQAIRKDNIVGFEDEEEKIIGYLKEKTEKLEVISIIGMPGLGKTTLAWKIFESSKIQFDFPIRIWVNISQVLNRRDVLLTILKQLTSQDMSGLSNHDLDITVRKRLEEGKFLLVMDDVWSVETWNDIKDVLPKTNMISKVMLTSRYTDVGTHANPTRDPHKLRFLTPAESWELLQWEVFGKLNDCPPKLENTGIHIANQCKGLPLALVVIGGILLDLRSPKRNFDLIKESWMEVSGNVSLYVKKNTEYDITEIVAMSYNRLPDDLRDCFIYLGAFPEDYDIPTWTLMRLWIAEGFIINKDGQGLEKIAEENLKELIERNLVMVGKVNPNEEVKTCSVHDVVRAFCLAKATEQNMYEEIRMSKEGVLQPAVTEIQKYRRLSIHSHVKDFLAKKPKGPRVRSLLSFNKAPEDLDAKYTSVISDGFELLRVLDSKSIKFAQFPKGVTKLIHLRYITVSGEDIDSLPKAISELWNLQTIVVNTNTTSLTVEANIWKMIQLRHVKTKASIVLVKGDGDGGENLQTLNRLSPDNCTEQVFDKARNLNTLGIRGNLNKIFSGGKYLAKLHRLEKLKMVNDRSSAGPLLSFPQRSFLPRDLRRLTISAAGLEWWHMSTLAMINSLRILKLKDKAFMGKSWKAIGQGFQELRYLLIEDTNLVDWEASADYFPSLESLVLKNCENLMKIPFELSMNLELLDIDRVGKSAVECAKLIEAAKEKNVGEESSHRWAAGFKLKIGPGCDQ